MLRLMDAVAISIPHNALKCMHVPCNASRSETPISAPIEFASTTTIIPRKQGQTTRKNAKLGTNDTDNNKTQADL